MAGYLPLGFGLGFFVPFAFFLSIFSPALFHVPLLKEKTLIKEGYNIDN